MKKSFKKKERREGRTEGERGEDERKAGRKEVTITKHRKEWREQIKVS